MNLQRIMHIKRFYLKIKIQYCSQTEDCWIMRISLIIKIFLIITFLKHWIRMNINRTLVKCKTKLWSIHYHLFLILDRTSKKNLILQILSIPMEKLGRILLRLKTRKSEQIFYQTNLYRHAEISSLIFSTMKKFRWLLNSKSLMDFLSFKSFLILKRSKKFKHRLTK